MKTKLNAVRLIIATVLLGGLASFAHAGPGPQYWETLRNEAQFKKLKADDKVAYVCNECKSVAEIVIESPAAAMALCKENATVTCPVCQKKAKVVMKRQRNDPATETVMVYTNEKGEECAFIAKIADKK